jgi:hypothetical protein
MGKVDLLHGRELGAQVVTTGPITTALEEVKLRVVLLEQMAMSRPSALLQVEVNFKAETATVMVEVEVEAGMEVVEVVLRVDTVHQEAVVRRTQVI